MERNRAYAGTVVIRRYTDKVKRNERTKKEKILFQSLGATQYLL